MQTPQRYEHERSFWDKLASARLSEPARSCGRRSLTTFEELCASITYMRPTLDYFGCVAGKRILDLACGDGWISLRLANSRADVYGCDISPKLIDLATRLAGANALEPRTHFRVMPAEEIDFDDGFFDCAVMHAALHHCDVERTVLQVRRVLKRGGRVAFIEDYAYHPLMKLYRWLTPGKRTQTEKPLTDEDVSWIVSVFSTHRLSYFGLTNLFLSRRTPLLRFADRVATSVDRCLYRSLPWTRRYSKLVSILATK